MTDNTIPVLDKGYLRLVDYTDNADLSVVRSARVSHDADWRTGENEKSDSRLIKYLWDHGHTSPFEHAVFTFEVKCPIFVARQWMRHRTWSYNEISARYTELPEEFYIPEVIGIQSKTNHQSRDIVRTEHHEDFIRMMTMTYEAARYGYKSLLEQGCPREIARSVLPVGVYTRFFASVNMHNAFKFLKERLDPGAQHEIQVYAKAMLDLIRPVAPVSVGVFEDK